MAHAAFRLRIVVGLLVAGALIPSSVVAQDQAAVRADVLLYGDDRNSAILFAKARRSSARLSGWLRDH